MVQIRQIPDIQAKLGALCPAIGVARWAVFRAPLWQATQRWLIALLTLMTLSACSTLSSTPAVQTNAQASWVLLPINNLSPTAQADVQAQNLMEIQLRARGVKQVDIFTPIRQVSLRGLLDTRSQLSDATSWARNRGYRYGLTGTVHEWQYQQGADKEPTVGVSLKLLDLASDTVLWQANAARTGWGYANLTTVANRVLAELMQQIDIEVPTR